MRYLCVHCDHRFDHEGDGKPRCPKCMRVHGIEPIAESRTTVAQAGGPRWVKPAIAVGVIAVVAAGYIIWSQRTPDAVGTTIGNRPLEPSELAGHLRRLDVRPPGGLVKLFEADEAIEQMAERATAGKSSPEEKAAAVVRAIRARASKQAFVSWSLTQPRETAPKTAADAWSEMHHDGARANLYPLEVAAVAIAALRSAGVDAMLAEIYAFPGDRSPPDPSGYFGYYGVAVYPHEVGEGHPKIYDPYGGRESEPGHDDYRLLDDVQAIGAAINLAAIHQLVRQAQPERAFELSGDALRLDARSPNARGVRGTVVITSGGRQEALREFEAAAEIRPDAPRKNNLAGVLIATGDVERAAREVGEALEHARDFAAAHATLAAVHLAGHETEEGQRELEIAQRLDPDLAQLPMLWANYYLAEGEIDQAVTHAREGVQRRPEDLQTRMMLASLYRQTGRYTEMRAEARAILERTPESHRDDMRAALTQQLGPTVFEEEDDTGTAEEGEDTGDLGDLGEPGTEGEAGGQFQLHLGGEEPGGTPGVGGHHPSLLDPSEQPQSPLIPGQDPSTLRLREPE